MVGALFALSGAAALVYQVTWQRLLALASGIGIYSVAMIVAIFMAGLGIGSEVGARLSRRVSARRALALFAAIELGVAAFALATPALYHGLLQQRLIWLYASPLLAACAHVLALLPPTTLMGMSLPLLVKAVVSDGDAAERSIGVLYGVNIVGASLGALLTPWFLIRHLGIPGAIAVGAALSGIAGAGALLLVRSQPDPVVVDAPRPERAADRPPGLWFALYAASGFCALALEILWFRLIDVAVKGTAFSFGSVLAMYLAGLAAGTLLGLPFVGRVRRPLEAFLACQCLLLLYAGLVVALAPLIPPGSLLAWYDGYWAQPYGFKLGRFWDGLAILRLYVLGPLVLYGPSTVLMGFSFLLLQRAVQDDPRTSGYKVGQLQAANIAGCVAGSLCVGLVALPRWGSAGTLRALLVAGSLFGLLGFLREGRRSIFPGLIVALLSTSALVPADSQLWGRLHGVAGRPAYFGEDAAGLVAITPQAGDGWRVSVNGRSISSLPFGGTHTELGALPVLMHPRPQRVAIVGLGSGDTAWAAGCRRETREVTVFEVCAPQLTLLGRVAAERSPKRLPGFLADPRFVLRFVDGRHALESEPDRYDVIEADPLLPYLAYSGNLASEEFFRACAKRLNRKGLMCAWASTPRAHATFRRVFPHVVQVSGVILVGSNDPLPVEPALWRTRLVRPAVRHYLGREIVTKLWQGMKDAVPGGAARPDVLSNRDLFPRDEFQSPE